MIKIAKDIQFDEREVTERFVRSSGPGGQNVNKVATAVELRLDIGKSSLPDAVKARLRALARTRIASDDVLTIDSRASRSQLQNREDALDRLVTLLKRAAVVPKKRTPTKPKPQAKERRLESKKRRSAVKVSRSRPATE
ncbi:MAG TPA: alternative ribosome rescue aminoacyl-tRNA hydrolase ArfB [Vicinamibacterales bacterium]|jgi:ribosome-associated protein|nr:alternative ribosome rescue aminoacyl-tRNA hydrolase ArfB [Vicinamibacterales bacterium]